MDRYRTMARRLKIALLAPFLVGLGVGLAGLASHEVVELWEYIGFGVAIVTGLFLAVLLVIDEVSKS